MADIKGIFVELETKSDGGGTSDHIYVGVFGKGGGSEFHLNVSSFNDFEAGTNI